jgi:hypothetical protein
MGNFVNSIFTPRGTNAREAQEADQGKVSGGYQGLFDALLPYIQDSIKSGGQLEPLRQAEIRRQLMLASPGNNAARQRMFQNQVFNNAIRSANTQSSLNRAAGFSGAYNAGARNAAVNQANDLSNKYAAEMYSPDGMMANSQMRLGAIAQGQSSPQLGMLNNFSEGVYGRPAVQVGQGAAGQIGQLAGTAASIYAASKGGGLK